MQNLNLRTVDNGYILETGEKTLVFTSEISITAWMIQNYPVPNTETLVSLKGVNTVNQISVIKTVREYFGFGLKETKTKQIKQKMEAW